MKRTLPRLAAMAAALTMAALFFTTSPTILAQDPGVTQLLIAQLDKFSGSVMLIVARELGVTEIRGKSLNQQGATAHNSPKRLVDVPIANTGFNEEQPALATSPKNKKLLVEGNLVFLGDVRCEERHSSDGGMTWSAPFLMPQLSGDGQCANPVLVYAPDGRRVYYAYMDIKFATTDWDIVVSYSDNNGATWSEPVTALEGTPGTFFYDKPWIGTPDDDPLILYVTATRFDLGGGCHIVFTRSTNGGTAYAEPQTLDSSPGCNRFTPSVQVVQGSRPSGGKFGNVVVAWYHSGLDGPQIGRFEIRIRHSADFGATFEPIVIAVDNFFETSMFKGPFMCYHLWWTSMFPDVEIDASGSAHIAYTYDPVAGSATAEEGDIRYVTSVGAPYTVWSAPVTVNDDGTASAQGYVAIDTQTAQTGQSANVHATWMDDRLPPPPGTFPQCGVDVENLYYDIFYSRKPPGEGWKPNNRISDTSSLSDFLFVGEYIDLSVDNGSLFTIWTDRRDKTDIFDNENDVWGSRTHLTQ
jgi:hypothetical protein